MKPIRPLFHLYGWNGTDLKWAAMHGQGPLALKWGDIPRSGGVPFASAFVDTTRGKILIPDDYDKTWTGIDREMYRVTLLSSEAKGCEVLEVTYTDLANYLLEIDAKKWLKEWNRPDRAIYYGLTVEQFKTELHDLWRSEWGDIPPPA